ncbi:MAG: hypothetical protein COZ46_06205 [Verrucomicrobia bacterium CG_4_10_14_3_um_filter_43_23]|nr:MAG: hypothetical protein AUJ82_07925 [Verrucomicrobia bacterium CG1_02_43_26]PIP59363.1 MAG: hypothetical protein COX01_04140 [Verrucomicrobia bacterium CG22_combo_CG10-13_8_21_14_all_43_17]PIX57988.1 MAG: hypothetical protein COZ46_06205 [Verrucomicrobia bacterium CG_4_10_14_3_um_filter_43_23]PIY61277.1 MAG: hypothetical protein COY94_06140 [Verrucomicrobia bacterium CG_4_10_14_0_8_um_filter_43_34]PJA44256.1 MAG: hypothetical protein CO175_03830 [Verrucomicrobia bacterium CG_4_9_14_3_um_fi
MNQAKHLINSFFYILFLLFFTILVQASVPNINCGDVEANTSLCEKELDIEFYRIESEYTLIKYKVIENIWDYNECKSSIFLANKRLTEFKAIINTVDGLNPEKLNVWNDTIDKMGHSLHGILNFLETNVIAFLNGTRHSGASNEYIM